MRSSVQISKIISYLSLRYLVIFWITVLVLQVQCRNIDCKISGCKFSCSNIPGYSDVVEINLSSLDSSSSSPHFKGIPDSKGRAYKYEWSPCTKFDDDNCLNAYACQVTGSSKYSLGSVLEVYYTTEQNQFILHYPSGDEGRKINVILDYEKDEEGRVSDVIEDPDKIYTMRLITRYAPHDGDDDDGGGISLGTILCIILLVVVILYLGIGIACKHRKGAQGKDKIPNSEFWANMPGLIKDGCIFSAQKAKACVSNVRERSGKSKQKNGGGYEKIEETEPQSVGFVAP